MELDDDSSFYVGDENTGGGFINVEEEEPESLWELANRVREVIAMRLCDRQGDT